MFWKLFVKERFLGWRLDYFIVSQNLMKDCVQDSIIHEDNFGSDHCPINLKICTDSLNKEKKITPYQIYLETQKDSRKS